MLDAAADVVYSSECLAAARLLLLSADAARLSSEATVSSVPPQTYGASVTEAVTSPVGVITCDAVRRCLLPVADVLMSAGTHVYLSTVKLHRAMSMMVALTTQLNASEGQNAAAADDQYIVFLRLVWTCAAKRR